MPALASVAPARTSVVPGDKATVVVTVRNSGSVVDEMTVTIVGEAAPWTRVEPSVVPLFPGAEAKVTLTFSPPRSSAAPSGPVDVGIKVTSREDPGGSTVEEAVVEVAPYTEVAAELVPRTVRGARRAKAELAVDNRGNAAVRASLSPLEADAQLTFECDPGSVEVEPGRAGFSSVRIKPVKPFLRGADRTFPYRVVAEVPGERPMVADGVFVQTAVLPRWMIRLLALLLIAALALLAMWQLVLTPAVQSAARTAANKQVTTAASKAAIETARAVGKLPADPNNPTSGVGGGLMASLSDDGQGGMSEAKRVSVEAAPAASGSGSYSPAPKGKRFLMTDIVLQNPQGDTGRIRIKRGDEVLIESALENFRDLDYHFLAPYVFSEKDFVVEVDCKNPANGQPCRDAVTVGGFVKENPPS